MKRLIDCDLKRWVEKRDRMPLILRGARQVGKTYAVRQLGKIFENYVEVNFEVNSRLRTIFDGDLNPKRIINDLAVALNKPIVAGHTLLFFDEIQYAPEAIKSLRYFYEDLPELHILAAGSLLDFVLEPLGLPPGVRSLYVYPMSFLEFLHAQGEVRLIEAILNQSLVKPLTGIVHEKLLELFSQYLLIGGMPKAVKTWRDTQDPTECIEALDYVVGIYKDDFGSYAKKYQKPNVKVLFESIPTIQGERFVYSAIGGGGYKKRDLEPALDLLDTAGIISLVFRSGGHKIPPGAEINRAYFKVVFVDIAIGQLVLGLNINEWFKNMLTEFTNKGAAVEAVIGQEMLAYSDSHIKPQLYYWVRQDKKVQAEVDYLMLDSAIVPIEVKSGLGASMASIKMFLELHAHSPFGVRFSPRNFAIDGNIHSYPLYAVATAFENFKKRASSLLD